MIPVITIGFPVYNVERFVERSLLSALEQNFEHPYEILVVDDCGKDSSMDIVVRMAASHPKGSAIRIVKHPQNKGLGDASNTIIDSALGEWLIFLDSDDRLTPDCLKLLYDKAIAENADFVIGNTRFVDFTSNDEWDYGAYHERTIRHESAAAYMLFAKLDNPGYERWNKLYNIHFLRNNSIRCIHRVMEDMYFSFNTYALADCIATVNKPTYLYNNSPRESIMANNLGTGLPQATMDIYLSLIKAMQEKMRGEYAHKKYIYDLYFYYVDSIWLSLKQTGKTPQNMQYMEDNTIGFASIVPNIQSLHTKTPRLFYMMANMKKANIIDYMHWVDRTNITIWRALRWVIAKL